jgi:hypothetical protein
METFARVNFLDFDNAAAPPAYSLDRVDAVPPVANE